MDVRGGLRDSVAMIRLTLARPTHHGCNLLLWPFPSMGRNRIAAFRTRRAVRRLTAVVSAMDTEAARGAIGAAPTEGQVRSQSQEKQRRGDAPDDGRILGDPAVAQQTCVDDISLPGHRRWIPAIHQQGKLRVV